MVKKKRERKDQWLCGPRKKRGWTANSHEVDEHCFCLDCGNGFINLNY